MECAQVTGSRKVVMASALIPEQSRRGTFNSIGFMKHNNGYVCIDLCAFYSVFTTKMVAYFFADVNRIIDDNSKGYAI